ncbi:hypothetical protein Pint_23915 [Pistacia integerrima]|uniref:Uncharacterized protein n=1 Tax=Pistacia integerrima TaxID=434235 RepID=A0ACC0YL09_9ROSI|nr:hypothetical protein Pint_23915 [Pistacia integerrima]
MSFSLTTFIAAENQGDFIATSDGLSSLQVLDLAENDFRGNIPSAFGKFNAMAEVQMDKHFPFLGFDSWSSYGDSLVNLRGQLKKTSSVIRIMLSIIFLLMVILLPEGDAYCLESDRRALVDFKSGLDDPKDRLASWKGESCWLQNLRSVDLVGNVNLTANCSQLFAGSWRMAEYINLEIVQLHGELPATIGNMTSLRFLQLFGSGVEGGLPSSIGKLCDLIFLELATNNLTKSLPRFLEVADNCGANSPLPSLRYLKLQNNKIVGELPHWLGQLRSLVKLDLGNNLLHGPIPASLGTLLHLLQLRLQGNKLNGSLPDSLGQLSELLDIDVSSNNLTGIIAEVHFSKLSKLLTLVLSSNSFILNVSSNWVPPFQVGVLYLGSCRLGPSFPYWLKSQRAVDYLDLSNASILGPIPNWFWDLSGSMTYFNLSFNQLQGQLPNPLNVSTNAHIDLSSNILKGSIPLPSFPLPVLALSNNEFSGPIPENIGEYLGISSFLSLSGNQLSGSIPESVGRMSSVGVIDLSRNNLAGRIPSSIANSSTLQVLDLQNNNLSGEIPSSLGDLYNLRSLHLSNNKISGEIPLSFMSLLSLETLDLGNNCLTGTLPPWLGDGFPYLRILSLRSNRFSGELPSSLSKLSSLQVLDLAENDFNGISVPYTVIAIRKSWWDAYMDYVDKTADRLSYLGYKVARRCRNNLKHN